MERERIITLENREQTVCYVGQSTSLHRSIVPSPPFSVSTIDSIPHGPRSRARNRMKLCWASTAVCRGSRNYQSAKSFSLFSLLFITSISKQMVAVVVVVHEEWNQRQRSVQSWMSAWATDQVPQRAGRLFFFLSLSRILDESWLFPFLIAFVWCKFFFLFTTRINPPRWFASMEGERERGATRFVDHL